MRLPSAASGHACLVCWRGHIPAEAPQKADRRPADNPFDGFIVARAVRTCGSRETHKKRANRGITKRGTRNLGAVGRRKQGGKPKAHNLGAFWVETDHGSARGHDRHVGEPKHQDKRDEETPGIPDPIRPAAKSMRVRVRVCLWGCVRVGCARTNVPHAVLYMFEVHVQMHYLGIGRNCAPRVCFSLFVNALTSAVVTVQVPINTNISLLCLGCFCFAKAKQKQARGVRLCTAE